MKPVFVVLLCTFCILAQAQKKNAPVSSGNSLQVKTASGIVEGVQEKSGIRSFKGIPYAAPPLGNLRWAEPQPAASWNGVLRADHFGPRAMQPPIFSDMVFRSDGMSEDCLYLNVWAPAKKGNGLLPVLVYFYGGGFIAGDGSEPRYDGESMAQKGIVALTVNYRLGLFGLFAHPELTKESPHHASGNYGLMDQSAALQWVQKNIAAFGGDPKKVTIAGESAGSFSVSAQMASPLSKNLISGAIGESGSLLGTTPPVSLSEAERTGLQFAQAIGAHSLAELRAIPADSLLKAASHQPSIRFSVNVDGYFFPRPPLEIFQSGQQAHVPLLVGWNSEENNYRSILGNENPTKENYQKAVQRLYGNRADQLLQVYAANNDDEVKSVATALAGDRFIGFSTWRWSDLQSNTGGKPVYRYFYEKARPATVGSKSPANQGAVHSSEIEYAMGNLSTNKVFAWTPDDYTVSKTIQNYFANFIKTGNPNGAGLPQWPEINGKNPVPVMHINVHSAVEPEKYRQRYVFMSGGGGE
ncbi:MAG: carboxylesterase/lipase family protein [Flavisolibacter sp.]